MQGGHKHGSITLTGDKMTEYCPETCQFSHPKKFKVFHPIYWESLGYSFWDSNGAVMTEYLSKDSTIPGAYYASGLHTLCEALKSKL